MVAPSSRPTSPADLASLIVPPIVVILLMLISFSTPFSEGTYFLKVSYPDGPQIRYGCLGFTGGSAKVGYEFIGINGTIIVDAEKKIPSTKILVLYPIAAFLSLLMVIFDIYSATRGLAHRTFMAYFSLFEIILTLTLMISSGKIFGRAEDYFLAKGCLVEEGSANDMATWAFILSIGWTLLALDVCWEVPEKNLRLSAEVHPSQGGGSSNQV